MRSCLIVQRYLLLVEVVQVRLDRFTLKFQGFYKLRKHDASIYAVFISDLRAKHEADGFLITKRNIIALAGKIEANIPDVLEACAIDVRQKV